MSTLKNKLRIQRGISIFLCICFVYIGVRIVFASTPNPGHPWTEVGDGVFQVTGPTALRTFTYPDANATVLTSNTAVTVAQGGTGTTTFPIGGFLFGNGTSQLAGSSSPTVGWITGTSTNSSVFAGPLQALNFVGSSASATTTLAGGLNIESGGFLYDLSTNNVGIGTTSPYTKLGVVGEVVASLFTATTTTATSTFQKFSAVTSDVGTVINGSWTASTIGIAYGGTGSTTLAQDGVLIGNGTSALNTVTPISLGDVLSVNASSTWESVQPTLGYGRRSMVVLKNAGAATVTAIGMTAPTLTATASNADDALGPLLSSATTAANGNVSGIISTAFTGLQTRWNVEYYTKIKTGSVITNTRLWSGIFSADPSGSAAPAVHIAAFRYDTTADGTAFWRTVTNNNTTATVTTTTSAIAASTDYDLRIVCSATLCTFYVNGTLVSTHSATLPTSSQALGYGNRITNLSAATHSLFTRKILINHDN